MDRPRESCTTFDLPGFGRRGGRNVGAGLLFNLSSALVGIALAPQLARLAQAISGGGNVGRPIANAQLVFNVIGVALVIGFVPMIARGLEKLIPESGGPRTTRVEQVQADQKSA